MQITLKDKAKIDFLTLLIDEGCTIYIFRCKSNNTNIATLPITIK
jgi:hypothetical protein